MKRDLEVTPQGRRDINAILAWHGENLGARAAQKVASTIRARLAALELGRARGAELFAGSPYLRIVAKKHVIIFLVQEDVIKVVRVVHGARDLPPVVRRKGDVD